MPAKLKAHEETWEASLSPNACDQSSRILVSGPPKPYGDEHELFYANDGGRANYMVPRVQFAACAPEMARMLLAREFGPHDEWNIDVCAECEGSPKHGGHTDDCAWLALMKRAGVR